MSIGSLQPLAVSLVVPVHSPVSSVIPAKAGIQYAGLACLAPDWIPAFAGMTMQRLISLLQTGSCPRERLGLVLEDIADRLHMQYTQ